MVCFFELDSVFEMIGLGEVVLVVGVDEVIVVFKLSVDLDVWILVLVFVFEEIWVVDGGVWVLKCFLEVDYIINLFICKNY